MSLNYFFPSAAHLNHQIEVAVKIFRTVLTLHIVPPVANSELLNISSSEILEEKKVT